MSQDRLGARRRAMTMPPTAIMGAVTSMVHDIMTNVWTCWTSLVLRVMREPEPKPETSRSEKSPTRSKTAARRSRPMPMAARAAHQVAAMVAAPSSTETTSMRPPVRQM